MKIACLLRGISYISNYKNNRMICNIDYRKCIDSFKNFTKGYDFDIFFHTYKNELIPQLIEDYNPISYDITDFNGQIPPNTSLRNSIKRVIEIFNKYVEKTKFQYDLIIITRFDLLYKCNFSDMNVTEVTNYFVDDAGEDNFLIVTPKYLQIYYQLQDFIVLGTHSPHYKIGQLRILMNENSDKYKQLTNGKGKHAKFKYYKICR